MDYDTFLEKIWNDADFKSTKKIVLNQKKKIKKLNYCKICNCEINLSSNYDGEFPLCKIHRDPNNRLKN